MPIEPKPFSNEDLNQPNKDQGQIEETFIPEEPKWSLDEIILPAESE